MSARLITVLVMVLSAALSRVVPHAPNFTAVTALAVFSGSTLRDSRLKLIAPVAAVLLSDALLGFRPEVMSVYAPLLVAVLIGTLVRRRTPMRIAGATLSASAAFFVLSNFAVWASGELYPRTLSGLATCYAAGLPFFRTALVADLSFAAILFGVFALLERAQPALRERGRPILAAA